MPTIRLIFSGYSVIGGPSRRPRYTGIGQVLICLIIGLWVAALSASDGRLQALQDAVYRDPGAAESLVDAAVKDGWLDSVQGHVVLARVLYQRNEFNGSMRELASAEPFAQVESEPLLYAEIRTLVAQNYYRMGSMDQSMIAARDALRALESIESPALSAQVHNIMGAVHLASGDRGPARDEFERSLQGFQAIGARAEIAKLHNNLGVLHIQDDQLDKAEPHLSTSLEMARELGRTTTIVANLVNLSELHAKRGHTDAAALAVAECFGTLELNEDESSKVWCHEAASVQLRAAGRIPEAIDESRAALAAAERLGLQQHVVESARALAVMLTQSGRHEEAAAMNDRAFVTMDAIRDQLLKLRLQQSNAVIEYERAKAEVRALRVREEHSSSQRRLMYSSLAVLIPVLFASLWLLASRGRAVRAMARLSARNERLAHTDELTGLPNRRAFLANWIEQPTMGAEDCVLMIDIDRFKEINDRHGHDAGDDVLRQMGRVLTRCLRPEDRAARWGGEEFVVLLAGSGLEGGKTFAARLSSMLRAEGNPTLPPITVSVGVSVGGDRPPGSVLKAADEAMYRAKSNGRDRVCVESGSE